MDQTLNCTLFTVRIADLGLLSKVEELGLLSKVSLRHQSKCTLADIATEQAERDVAMAPVGSVYNVSSTHLHALGLLNSLMNRSRHPTQWLHVEAKASERPAFQTFLVAAIGQSYIANACISISI